MFLFSPSLVILFYLVTVLDDRVFLFRGGEGNLKEDPPICTMKTRIIMILKALPALLAHKVRRLSPLTWSQNRKIEKNLENKEIHCQFMHIFYVYTITSVKCRPLRPTCHRRGGGSETVFLGR